MFETEHPFLKPNICAVANMAPTSRQPILFPELEDIEFCSCRADLVTQHDGEVYVCNPDNAHCYIFYHRDLQPDKLLQTQVFISYFSVYQLCLHQGLVSLY